MKTKQAVEIAETLWNDTVQNGSMFDSMMKMAPEMQKLKSEGNTKEIQNIVVDLKTEIVARWANIILEVNNDQERR